MHRTADQLSTADAEVLADALAWLRRLDLATAGPDTLSAVDDVADVLGVLRELEAVSAAPAAVEFVSYTLFRLLIVAQTAHERETGTLEPAEEPISAAEFRRRHIAPIEAEARRVVRVIRRQARPDRGTRCHVRPRGRRRRTAARRAAGARSGNDPGPGEP